MNSLEYAKAVLDSKNVAISMFLLSKFTPTASQKFQHENTTSKNSSSSEFFQ